MNSEAKVARIHARLEKEKLYFDTFNKTTGEVTKVLTTLLDNTWIKLVLANMLVETLQRIKVESEELDYSKPIYSGQSHVRLGYEHKREPILSQALGTTLESVMNTATAIEAVGGIAGLAKLLIK